MQLNIYLGLVLIFIALHFMIRYLEKDNQYKLLFHLFFTLIFITFAILSFYNYTLVYDVALSEFVKYYEASDSLDPWIYFLITAFFALVNGFSIITNVGEEWSRLRKVKEMKRNY